MHSYRTVGTFERCNCLPPRQSQQKSRNGCKGRDSSTQCTVHGTQHSSLCTLCSQLNADCNSNLQPQCREINLFFVRPLRSVTLRVRTFRVQTKWCRCHNYYQRLATKQAKRKTSHCLTDYRFSNICWRDTVMSVGQDRGV